MNSDKPSTAKQASKEPDDPQTTEESSTVGVWGDEIPDFLMASAPSVSKTKPLKATKKKKGKGKTKLKSTKQEENQTSDVNPTSQVEDVSQKESTKFGK